MVRNRTCTTPRCFWGETEASVRGPLCVPGAGAEASCRSYRRPYVGVSTSENEMRGDVHEITDGHRAGSGRVQEESAVARVVVAAESGAHVIAFSVCSEPHGAGDENPMAPMARMIGIQTGTVALYAQQGSRK